MADRLPTTTELVARFKRKYPATIGWRYKKNSAVVEKHLNPGEEVVYAFIAQKNDKLFQIFGKNEYLMYFPLLKSDEKVKTQDEIWKKVCEDLNWPFYPSV